MKKLLKTLTISSLVVLAGCSSAELPTNTNETGESNTNTQVVVTNTDKESNTNEVVNENSNANINADTEFDEEDTSDWLTYTNEQYGFSVKYPKDWTIEENNNNCLGLTSPIRAVENEEFIKKFNDPDFGTDAYFPHDIIVCLEDSNGMSLADWVTDEVPEFEIISRDDIVIDNRPAIQLIRDNLGTWQRTYALFDGRILSITHSSKDTKFSQTSTLNKIVQSVKFLQVDNSDWLTYTNEEYGFSFKYPAEWGDIEEAESGIGKSIYFDHINSSLSHDNSNWVPPIHLQWAFKDTIQTDCTKDDTEEVYWAVNRECQILDFNGESYKQTKSYLTEGMVWNIAYLLRDRDSSFSISMQILSTSDDEIEESDYYRLLENILRTVSID